jgi:sterol desaturase/sphingolipid hydroxylase (fatty acid hydroxylase superfamily)
MRLSKAGYYADFVVYPPIVLSLAVAASFRAPSSRALAEWVIACAGGVATWTLIEYIFHRFVLHQVPYVAKLHDMHHKSPSAFVGTPTWLSLPAILVGAFLPLWWNIDFTVASGLTAGVMLGYVGYVGVHHALHHWRIGPSSLLYQLKLRHAQHHHIGLDGNFGVTNGFWDRLFGTELASPRKPARA